MKASRRPQRGEERVPAPVGKRRGHRQFSADEVDSLLAAAVAAGAAAGGAAVQVQGRVDLGAFMRLTTGGYSPVV